jgi:tryptophanyl-tRNA synthetase
MAIFPERVFSGVQPTGNLHLGNYLGAIKRFVAMQATHPCIYCVVDLHAMTLPHVPAELARTTREVTAAFIACGIDPKANIVFNQSQVAEHAELAWIFDCVARLGWLNRMTQFKEKAGKDRENASIGLYNYPVLMAADILVYRATHVPVGDDQKQHLELARDIAQKFNKDFADSIGTRGHGDAFFPLPEPLIQGPATRVMSLRDGTKKMSKSDPSEYAHIALTDDADAIAQKIRRAKTDPEPLPSEVEGLARRPEADNLVGIFAGLNDETKAPVLGLQDGARRPRHREARADSLRNPASVERPCLYRRRPRNGRGKGARHRAAEYGRNQGHPRPGPIARMGISEANIFVTFIGESSPYDRDERRRIIYSLCGPDAYEI